MKPGITVAVDSREFRKTVRELEVQSLDRLDAEIGVGHEKCERCDRCGGCGDDWSCEACGPEMCRACGGSGSGPDRLLSPFTGEVVQDQCSVCGGLGVVRLIAGPKLRATLDEVRDLLDSTLSAP